MDENKDFDFEMDEYDEMDYDFDSMFGFDKLNLPFAVHVEGIEGECFEYNVYFKAAPTEADAQAVSDALGAFIAPYEKQDIYPGYISSSLEEGKVFIYLDLGNVNPRYENTMIEGIVAALRDVPGIDRVIVNEGF